MTKFKKNIKVLIIDRGYLEKQTLYEEAFLSYLQVQLAKFERKLRKKDPDIQIRYDTISVMKEINNGKIFDFVKNKEKVKEQKMNNFRAIERKFDGYTSKFSTDVIKNSSNGLSTLYVYVVYTESQEEIEQLCKRYTVKAILKFEKRPEEPDNTNENINKIYIDSSINCVRISEKMIPLLFQDLGEVVFD